MMIEDHDWEELPLEERPISKFPMLGSFKAINRWRDLEFHGDFQFYGGERGDWHEYLARSTHGQLDTIVVIPENSMLRPVSGRV
ncbi:hypothetical protein M2341_000271 [Sphingobium sp. B7D2B]|uniref:hypothetical protein n=1 Tax=Sphingobium sp. B7D2B TaxID=2940583 RepID=UPI0022256DA2|nr:hypothetical protein [Sphingobium sp. B7D2B]MCW2364824.1 hypothetical protein [Sphingobium sp. B7D2B]